ncbi:AraC family transcriptional regulator [Vallitalea guaymasensis]|uniref:AraC family transcriptional regulator n=1 Tax=Vallitalea guaymasensis TaxID=1185412 RepID=UPI00187D672D|nr:AraC family transcriptional regulator [Vallitalea guaymasensis]
MLKKDIITDNQIENIKSIFSEVPYKYHFKIHTAYNIDEVPLTWKIEDNRRNKDFHIIFIKGGSGYYYLNGKKEQLKRGKVIFVSNDFPHSAIPDKSNLPSIMPIRFGLYDNKTSYQRENYFSHPFSYTFHANDIIKYQKLFERLYQIANGDSDLSDEMCNSIMTQIFYELVNDYECDKEYKKDSRIESVKIYIDENPSSMFTINDLAKLANLSKKQFTRLFNVQYKISPYQYIIKSKIRYATFLLEETEMSVKEISNYLGYPNQYSFSKQFKKCMGCAPSLWNQRRA